MVEQLSFRLEAGTPRLPATLRPMLAQRTTEPFDSADHVFEPSWGGTRVLAFVEDAANGGGASLRILDERGRDLATLLPELGSLREAISARSAILDGEIAVVDRMGRADPLALASRLRGKPGPPVVLLAFDLVFRDGKPLFNQPLDKRRQALRALLRPGAHAIVVPSISGEGRALYEAVVTAGIAGVTGRLRKSPYLPGVRSRMWRFVAKGVENAGASAAEDADATAEPDGAEPSGGRVIALIRRLPLDDYEP